MKTRIAIAAVMAIALFTSCKDEKSVESLEVKKSEVTNENFKVTLNVIAKKDDTFSLFYTEDGTSDFKAEPIWVGVKGSDAEQQVLYSLPADVYPTQLRIDLGMNKDQQDITLKNIGLEYQGGKRVIAGAEMGNFFRADDSKCTFNPATGEIKALVKDGARQNPSLYPHEANLGPELQKLAK
ncbi:hypothetical protein [Flavobacterium selenitireducens]|uniref:hypothetical protein n=1 Tax=Flavobacterium selenitireducens TaxID=2722704 RepID=UPI00168A4C37|nr:hypothetical protein [Flavobacterium selenitireducens]MBD3581585.1 hypothetical protein [Flavobacterium selenitireducens]